MSSIRTIDPAPGPGIEKLLMVHHADRDAFGDAPPLPPPLVDTHAHLAEPRLLVDLPGLLDRASRAGVVQIVIPGTTVRDSESVIKLAAKWPGLFAAVAIHPNEGAESAPADLRRIDELAREAQVVAIGETGLDRYWDRTPFPRQQALFDHHLDLAQDRGWPVIIHCRDCYADVIAQLEHRRGAVRGVLHSFTGTAEDAAALLELGLFLSFAGMMTFANTALEPLRAIAAETPSDRLLIETDSPYLTPHPFRGKVNEPARLALTAARLAELRGLSVNELAALTTANARRLFALPADCLLSRPD